MLRLPSALLLTPNGAWVRRALVPTLMAATWTTPAWSADLLTIAQDALNNNAALASTRLETRSTESARNAAEGGLLPQINATGSVAHSRTYESQSSDLRGANPAIPTGGDDNINSVNLSLEATQALFDAIARRDVERTERQIDQQLYQLAATEQQVLIDVASAYFEILRAHELLESRRAQERAIGRQLEQAREQFEVGLIAITEVEEAKAAFDQSRATRIAAESDLQVRFEALERLTGERYANIEALGEAMPVTPPTNNRDHWVALAVENNPLVLASQAGVELRRSGLALAEAQRLPSVNAFANYNYADNDADGVSGYNSDSQLGVRVSLPLYTGGTTTATIQENTFLLESSQYDFEDQRRETVQQVRSRYTQVSNNVSTVEARQQAIVSNQSALDATRAGYEVGTRNIVDVLNAERNLYNAIAEHASARYDYVINLLTLRQQAGTLDVAALEEVNTWLDGDSVEFTLPEEGDSYDEMIDIGEPPQPLR
ncbi:TolC family outer membrane protein [Halomonas vilamensis]|uniref:TolC family outer membrane protein n=1 Tax=Vreelandella vilamensis TaxID=531309 RepID=A0ABU1H1F0_9GAMM|nr:TolC family outer membrane protein [Halomonas vilamensis]MDR5897940.1 TolC family outer membrane protein [Halomonas vilamensis]